MKKKGTFIKVRRIVSRIPRGKVATYGQIAKFLKIKSNRVVGWALIDNQDSKIPCHRVVRKEGFLAEKYSLGGWKEQKIRLEKEGVRFIKKNQVDFSSHRWKIK